MKKNCVKLIPVLASLTPLLGWSDLLSAWAVQPNANYPFIQWCEQRQFLSKDTANTIEALLRAIGTQDCWQAQRQLRKIKILRTIGAKQLPVQPQSLVIVLTASKTKNARATIDLEPIVAAMPQLRQLELTQTSIVNLAPIGKLTQLTRLRLTTADLEDVTPIASLTELEWLNLQGNRIQNISSLAVLHKLKYLNVGQNNIRDFSVLSQLPNLFSVNLRGNPIDTSTCLGKWADACEIE